MLVPIPKARDVVMGNIQHPVYMCPGFTCLKPADSVVALVFAKTRHELDCSVSTCATDFVTENPWIL